MMEKKNSFINQLKDGLIFKNPIFVQLIGMCPTLATTTTAANGLAMGLAATVVLIFSNVFISLLRKFIPKQVRIAAYIVIISGFVTIVEMLMHAYFLSLYNSLGVFIPLIVVNCIILARAESFASKNPVIPSAFDGLSMGLGFTFALTLLGVVRELIGSGSVFGFNLIKNTQFHISLFVLPAGAFITLGVLIAVMNKILSTVKKRKTQRDENTEESEDV